MRDFIDKNRGIFLVLVIFLVGLLVIGGTYAFFIYDVDVKNGNYISKTECFLINYSILNDDGTQKITGTLFPTIDSSGGLNGKVSLNVDNSCNISGTGSLYMHINNGTSTTLVQTVGAHCENATTLETLNQYKGSSSNCTSNNGKWVTNGTALKYAVYDSNNTSGAPLNTGYITSGDIGKDILIYTGFDVNHTVNDYYIYIWMDGYLMDEGYTNLPFGGYIHASVLQNQ